MQGENETRDKNIKSVSIIGICANIFLLLIKATIGIISMSQAMLADALNSAGDIFASFMSYIGAKFSSKPSDNDHPYGHGKAEYVFSFVISLSMIIASFVMIKSSVESILSKKEVDFSYFLIITCLITILVKFILYIYTKKKYSQTKSILIRASKEDHRNDIFVTIGTNIGIISSYFGFYFIDGLVGILISLWITYVGINLLIESYKVLMDTGLSDSVYKEIITIIENEDRVMHVDDILSKPIGNRYIIIVKLSMDGSITLEESHNIGGKIKESLIKNFEFICDVIIHINPHSI